MRGPEFGEALDHVVVARAQHLCFHIVLRARRHILECARGSIKTRLEDDRGQPRRPDKIFHRVAQADGMLVTARDLQREQELDIVLGLHDHQRPALCAGSATQRVLVAEKFADVRLVLEKVFDFIARRSSTVTASSKFSISSVLLEVGQVCEFKRVSVDAGQFVTPKRRVASGVRNQMLQSTTAPRRLISCGDLLAPDFNSNARAPNSMVSQISIVDIARFLPPCCQKETA